MSKSRVREASSVWVILTLILALGTALMTPSPAAAAAAFAEIKEPEISG